LERKEKLGGGNNEGKEYTPSSSYEEILFGDHGFLGVQKVFLLRRCSIRVVEEKGRKS